MAVDASIIHCTCFAINFHWRHFNLLKNNCRIAVISSFFPLIMKISVIYGFSLLYEFLLLLALQRHIFPTCFLIFGGLASIHPSYRVSWCRFVGTSAAQIRDWTTEERFGEIKLPDSRDGRKNSDFQRVTLHPGNRPFSLETDIPRPWTPVAGISESHARDNGRGKNGDATCRRWKANGNVTFIYLFYLTCPYLLDTFTSRIAFFREKWKHFYEFRRRILRRSNVQLITIL